MGGNHGWWCLLQVELLGPQVSYGLWVTSVFQLSSKARSWSQTDWMLFRTEKQWPVHSKEIWLCQIMSDPRATKFVNLSRWKFRGSISEAGRWTARFLCLNWDLQKWFFRIPWSKWTSLDSRIVPNPQWTVFYTPTTAKQSPDMSTAAPSTACRRHLRTQPNLEATQPAAALGSSVFLVYHNPEIMGI